MSGVDENTVARLDRPTVAELLVAIERLRAEHGRLVCTLDDVDQCRYTSGHASLDERLDDGVAAALEAPAHRVAWADLPGDRIGGAADVVALLTVHREPDLALDDVVFVQRMPVDRDDLVIAGLPNGYFAGDWNVFQNHAVIRRMAGHGYRHFGVGAALLGFDRPTAPTPAEAQAIVDDLVHLYGAPDSPDWAELAALLTARPLLFLGYAENVADQF